MSFVHLANEITESQKINADFLKWKIIVVAVLLAIGFGISTDTNRYELALCVIPLVMTYIDALCGHIYLKIYTIGRWHQSKKSTETTESFENKLMKDYETFARRAHDLDVFQLELKTALYSSALINGLLIIFPLFEIVEPSFKHEWVISGSGFLGLTFTGVLFRHVLTKKQIIEELS